MQNSRPQDDATAAAVPASTTMMWSPEGSSWPPPFQYQYQQYIFPEPPLSPGDIEEMQGDNGNGTQRRIGWGDFFRFNTGEDEAKLDRVLGIGCVDDEDKKKKRRRKRKRESNSSNRAEETSTSAATSVDNNNNNNNATTTVQNNNHIDQEVRKGRKRPREETVVEQSEADDDGDDDDEGEEEAGFSSSDDDDAGGISRSTNRRRNWDDYFALLIKYRDVKGNTWVPYKYKKDQPFAYWVHAQRKLFTQRKQQGTMSAMSDERFMYLDSIGFEEERMGDNNKESNSKNTENAFKKRLAELKAFKKEFKHTRVPKDYDDVPGLRKWVVKMRRLYKQGNQGASADLTQEEIDELDEIGFQWKTQGRKSEKEKTNKKRRERSRSKDKDKNNKGTHKKAKNKDGAKSRDEELEAAWWARFKMLEQFKRDNNGEVTVPKNYEGDPSFANWFNNERFKYSQRARGDQGAFPEDRYQAFLNLGVKPNSMSFKKALEYLEAFKKEYKHTRVPKGNMIAPQLRQWVVKMRKQYKAKQQGNPNDLSQNEIDQLNSLGFEWIVKKADTSEPAEVQANGAKKETTENGKENGTTGVKLKKIDVNTQKTKEGKPAQKITNNKKQNKPSAWERRLKQLEDYKAYHGNTKVPRVYHSDQQFASWVERQREKFTLRKRGDKTAMSDRHFHAFEKLGFEERKDEAQVKFKTRLAQLQAFKEEKKHLNVPKDYDKISGLGDWVSKIRAKFKEDRAAIPQKAFTQLNAIGFNWSEEEVPAVKDEVPSIKDVPPRLPKLKHKLAKNEEPSQSDSDSEDSFECRLSQLQAFKHQYGSTRVPKDYDSIQGLYAWTRKLRKAYQQRQQGNQSALSEEEIQALNEIHFDWALTPGKKRQSKETLKLSWFARLNQLREYKDAHGGSTAVPLKYDADPLFGHWVKAQRELFTRKKHGDEDALSDERFKALQELGFEEASGDASRVSFNTRISQLREFQLENNHTRVPVDYEKIPGLGKWVSRMRGNYKSRLEGDLEAISDRTINEMNEIGFEWQLDSCSSKKSQVDGSRKTAQTTENSSVQAQNDAYRQELTWAGRLQQLKDYKEANGGSTKVPSVYPPDQTFSNWVRTQRNLFSRRVRGDKSALSDDRYLALKDLGFEASAKYRKHESSWEARIEQLREYKEKYGNIDVTPNNPLYSWYITQRAHFDKKKRGEASNLNDLRFVALKSLGFE